MARKPLGFRPSLRAQQEASLLAQRFMAMAAPDEKRPAADAYLAQQQAQIKPKQPRAKPRKLEAPVINAISDLLATHPRVIWAARFNSGAASYQTSSGRLAPVWFQRFLRTKKNVKMRLPDFFGLYDDPAQKRVIPLAIEAKAPGWTVPTDDREREQENFLHMIVTSGGIGFFATSADQVAEMLR